VIEEEEEKIEDLHEERFESTRLCVLER